MNSKVVFSFRFQYLPWAVVIAFLTFPEVRNITPEYNRRTNFFISNTWSRHSNTFKCNFPRDRVVYFWASPLSTQHVLISSLNNICGGLGCIYLFFISAWWQEEILLLHCWRLFYFLLYKHECVPLRQFFCVATAKNFVEWSWLLFYFKCVSQNTIQTCIII